MNTMTRGLTPALYIMFDPAPFEPLIPYVPYKTRLPATLRVQIELRLAAAVRAKVIVTAWLARIVKNSCMYVQPAPVRALYFLTELDIHRTPAYFCV